MNKTAQTLRKMGRGEVCGRLEFYEFYKTFLKSAEGIIYGLLKRKGYRFSFLFQDNIRDVAIDATATLFERDERGGFRQIQRMYQKINGEEKNDIHFLNCFMATLQRRIIQEIANIFGQQDREHFRARRRNYLNKTEFNVDEYNDWLYSRRKRYQAIVNVTPAKPDEILSQKLFLKACIKDIEIKLNKYCNKKCLEFAKNKSALFHYFEDILYSPEPVQYPGQLYQLFNDSLYVEGYKKSLNYVRFDYFFRRYAKKIAHKNMIDHL